MTERCAAVLSVVLAAAAVGLFTQSSHDLVAFAAGGLYGVVIVIALTAGRRHDVERQRRRLRQEPRP